MSERDADHGSPATDGDETGPARVRIRGIYTTALTRVLDDAGHAVVQASEPIERRFEGDFDVAPADVRLETTRDREGIEASGDPGGVAAVADAIEGIAIDAFRWADEVPRGAVFDAAVRDAGGGGGAVVSLGDGERGYLPYDAVDGYVDDGDEYRVQVTEPTPPWSDDLPRVEPTVSVSGGLCTLTRGRTGVRAVPTGERGEELVGLTDLLDVEVPDGWGLRWERPAVDADLESMGTAIERASERAARIEAALADEPESPTDGEGPARAAASAALVAPNATTWCWFGRESRFALDDARRAVETTMTGHHRTKAADRTASAAVDFAEAVCGDLGAGFGGESDEFPFAAVSRQFGPTAGDRLAIGHGKPDGRLIGLGTGEVTDWSEDGSITVERAMAGGGEYDGLGAPKESGDVAVTKLREGRWWYPTTYKRADGTVVGTYVNVCTPVELFPETARYVDLYVDVIRHADGTVEIVDEAELAEAVADGLVTEELAEKARTVASAVERALAK